MEVNFINNNYIFQQKVHFSYILSSKNVYKSGYFEKKLIFWKVDILKKWIFQKVDFVKKWIF